MLNFLKNNRLVNGFKNYFAAMKGMTFKEKLEHTWFSYKLEMYVACLFIFVLAVVISCVLSANTKILLAGDVMNVEMTDMGMSYISDEYFETLGVRKFLNKVQVVKTAYSTTEEDDYQYNYNVSSQTLALVAARRLDFQIINLPALEMFFSEGIYLDLREFMTEGELAQWEGKIIYLEDPETNERKPVALEITETGFIRDTVIGSEKVFFAVINTTPRVKETRAFFDYVLSWEYQGIEPTLDPFWNFEE